jgi:uncharacterized glyoxalase superfamily protein PhnB
MHIDQAIIAHLTIKNAADAIEFYKKAFGFKEVSQMPMPDGRIMHCEMRYGPCMLLIAGEFPGMGSCKSPATLGGTTVTLHLNTPDVDALFAKAVAAGAKPVMPPADMFWGDRYGQVEDPFGHHWSLGTHKEDVSPEEMKRRGEEMMTKWKPGAA